MTNRPQAVEAAINQLQKRADSLSHGFCLRKVIEYLEKLESAQPVKQDVSVSELEAHTVQGWRDIATDEPPANEDVILLTPKIHGVITRERDVIEIRHYATGNDIVGYSRHAYAEKWLPLSVLPAAARVEAARLALEAAAKVADRREQRCGIAGNVGAAAAAGLIAEDIRALDPADVIKGE